MLRIEKRFRRLLVWLVVIMNLIYAAALVGPDMRFKAINVPDCSQITARFDIFSTSLTSEKEKLSEFPERVHNSIERVLQVYEYIINLKTE